MKYNTNLYEKIYFILLVLNTLIICFIGINYISYFLLMYLVTIRLSRKISNDNFLLLSLFIPSKYLQLVAIPIYIALNTSMRTKKLNKSELFFVIYIFLIGLINCIIYSNMPLGTIFQVGVYYCIFKVLASFGQNMDHMKTFFLLDKMLFVQLIACFIEFIKYKAIGDPITGTLISAHYLGVYFIVYLILLIRLKPYKYSSVDYILRVILVSIAIYVSDAKHVWVIFIFAFVVSWVLTKLKIKKRIMLSIIIMTVVIVAGTFYIMSPAANEIVSKFNLTRIYILNENYNKKIVFFLRTFKEMFNLNGVFGFGVGQFGSQISLTLSKGIIYRWDSSVSSFHYAIFPYVNAINGLMTEWYTKYGISLSSMVLGYPLVSFIGLFAELGVIGYVWLLKIFDRRFKNDNSTFIIAFFMLSIFDTYFEIPCVFILVLIATYANPIKKNTMMEE